jgi:alpha-beta hydrolase superfamily lysophospholipase
MAPDLCVGNGLNPHKISRDTQTVTAYQHDPQIHDRISARLGRFIAQEGSAVRQLAKGWGIPTLLLYAGDDQLVNPTGSVAFAQAAPAHMLEAHCFPNMYHEIFNEPEGEQVYSKLKAWLDSKI